MEFKYAVFDFDMTLIDSIRPLMASANLIAAEFGLPEVDYDQVRQAEIAVPNCTFEKLWEGLWGRYEPKWFEAYVDHMTDVEYKAMELYPGGRETLETLAALNVPLGLASNRNYPREALEALGIDRLFGTVVGIAEVERPKPAPDVLIRALELMKAPAGETLYVCDSTGDLKVSAAAGVRAFSMTTGGHSAAELLALGAWRVGDELAEIIPLFRP
jgi:HAD superfamily hydrolase (TIGR01509 family)